MKKKFTAILATFIIILMLFSLSDDNKILVKTQIINQATVSNSVVSNGYIEQKDKDLISIDQNGIVQSINFSVGDEISKGDEIMVISKAEVIPYVSTVSIDRNLIGKSNILSTNDEIITIISNVNGKIISMPDAVGSAVIKGVPFLAISDEDNLIAKIEVSEKYISSIEIGQTVELTGNGFDQTFEGTIYSISPEATKTFDILGTNSDVFVEVLVELSEQNADIISGLSVTGKIIVDTKQNALVVPYEAIFQEGTEEFVYTLKQNIVTKTPIKTGYELNSEIEVVDGLNLGDILVLNTELNEGDIVYSE